MVNDLRRHGRLRKDGEREEGWTNESLNKLHRLLNQFLLTIPTHTGEPKSARTPQLKPHEITHEFDQTPPEPPAAIHIPLDDVIAETSIPDLKKREKVMRQRHKDTWPLLDAMRRYATDIQNPYLLGIVEKSVKIASIIQASERRAWDIVIDAEEAKVNQQILKIYANVPLPDFSAIKDQVLAPKGAKNITPGSKPATAEKEKPLSKMKDGALDLDAEESLDT